MSSSETSRHTDPLARDLADRFYQRMLGKHIVSNDDLIRIREELETFLSKDTKEIPAISKWREMLAAKNKDRPLYPGTRETSISAMEWWNQHYKADADAGLLASTDVVRDSALVVTLRRAGIPLSSLVNARLSNELKANIGADILGTTAAKTKHFLHALGRGVPSEHRDHSGFSR